MEKKKYFEKTKVAQIAHKIVYGWTWLKEFCVANLGLTAAEVVPDHLYIAHHLRAPKQIGASKQEYFSKIFTARK